MVVEETGSSSRVGVGILGVTGYAGAEALRLLLGHPRARLVAAAARQQAGQPLAVALPGLAAPELILDGLTAAGAGDLATPAAWRARGVEVVFACLPHGVLASQATDWLAAGLRLIDLSADFRLRDPAAYPVHYQLEHPAPALLAQARYGLGEWQPAPLTGVRLIASPGCYATAILLAALPAAAAGWLDPTAPILITAMSGITGAGRGASLQGQLAELSGNIVPYKVGEAHAHLGEIRQALAEVGCRAPVLLSPHLVPMARGLTAHLSLSLASPRQVTAAQALYAERYAEAPWVQVLPPSQLPEVRYVRGSNRCDLAVRTVADGRVLQIYAALDNLIKGAAGQAIQSWNRSQGWAETLGLPMGAWPCS